MSPFDAFKQFDPERGDFWSARDLQVAMGYDRWERFESAVERAIAACENSGSEPKDHFRGAAKKVPVGSGAVRAVTDWHLSRYASYLVAMNGDPRKAEIASAQTYFAVRTREAETAAPISAAPALPQDYEEALVALLGQVRETKALAAKVAELEPAAASWQVLASGDGDFSVADAAKILSRDPHIKLGRNRLFTVLDEYRWTYRQIADDRPRVMQTAVERGWLSELPQSHYHPRTGELVLDAPQVRVTAKGLSELHKRLGGSEATIGGVR
ncbi:phage antirepressor KilAC domain-containing protein [Streptomyces acidiscabies]|uniref:phage antirepressor KilAC domain-containing protein n=1 Tax=Streptomyces acidiscabies TaxID=42234 RepID=UPI001C4D5567|nr:phage antirepressor KilAC domain-containing protein [Streptomyces acidiscabies]